MAELPVPALEQEYWLWTRDLTLGDPFYIIPLVNATIIYLTIKRGGEMGTTQMQGGMMVFLSYLMPVLSFTFMMFQPGTVQLYFLGSGLLGFAQSRLLTNDSFRSFMGLQPVILNVKKKSSADNGKGPATKIITTTSTTGDGALKLYQPPRQPTQTSNVSTNDTSFSTPKNTNVSIIDKFVDRAKVRKNEAVGGWYDMLGTTKEKKVSEAQRQKELRDSERYVKRLEQEEEWKREERNRLAAMDLEDAEEEPRTGTGTGPGERKRRRRRERR